MWRVLVVVVALTACSKKKSSAPAASGSGSGTQAAARQALGGYVEASKATEARLQLNRLAKDAKVAFAENAAFPEGKAGPTPAAPCCAAPDHRCPASQDWASSKVWAALDFTIDEPSSFQYSYASDGKTFTATAVGDLDCDGTAITYKMEGHTEAGNPVTKLTPPPPNSD